MRSRFTAFAVGDAAHLLRTWHPSTRPSTLELDDETRWLRLDVERTEPALVEFIAYYRRPEGRGRQHEVSRFVHEDERWFYLDGVSV